MKSLVIASLLVSTLLLAAKGYDMPSFNEFDTNGDGVITQVEFDNSRQKRMQEKSEEGRLLRNAANAPSFEDIDLDGNGNIDQKEFKIHQQK
jgi:Ca2+-binding EF-hand superfamily protein